RALALFAVDAALDREVGRVERVRRHAPRAHGAKALVALGAVELAVFLLRLAVGRVVQDREAEDVVHGRRARDLLAAVTDEDRELALVVDRVAALGDVDLAEV